MSKAMFGIGAALALTISPAWAGDEKADEKVAVSDTIASAESKIDREGTSESAATRSSVEPGRGSATMQESNEVRASFEERWLREREGYRDGGY